MSKKNIQKLFLRVQNIFGRPKSLQIDCKLNDGILEAAEVHFASGRRTVVSGARVISGARAVNGARIVNGAEQKSGRLDQMLRTTVWGGRSGRALPPQPKTGRGAAPPAKTEFFFFFQM